MADLHEIASSAKESGDASAGLHAAAALLEDLRLL
jgi:hypothetical protein